MKETNYANSNAYDSKGSAFNKPKVTNNNTYIKRKKKSNESVSSNSRSSSESSETDSFKAQRFHKKRPNEAPQKDLREQETNRNKVNIRNLKSHAIDFIIRRGNSPSKAKRENPKEFEYTLRESKVSGNELGKLRINIS